MSAAALRAERFAAVVADAVAAAPPLTDEQAERLAALLRSGSSSRTARP